MNTAGIVVLREGDGPEVLLVHGGASPNATWAPLRPLAARWTLVLAYRRGFPPSPLGPGDFEVDAADLVPLLEGGPHVVAHSYGVLGALLAAVQSPASVRSLTLLEPPLYCVAPEDPDVEHLARMGDAFLEQGLDADPALLREFLRMAGSPDVDDGPLPEEVARSVRRAQGGRSPREARPRLNVLREAKIPALVASGGHAEACERICDALADELNAQRLVAPGAGHFVAAAPGFLDSLERFLIECS